MTKTRQRHIYHDIPVWAQRIKKMRLLNHLTQEDVADLLKCSQASYGTYELGKRRISVDNLLILARYYRTSMNYLSGQTDVM